MYIIYHISIYLNWLATLQIFHHLSLGAWPRLICLPGVWGGESFLMPKCCQGHVFRIVFQNLFDTQRNPSINPWESPRIHGIHPWYRVLGWFVETVESDRQNLSKVQTLPNSLPLKIGRAPEGNFIFQPSIFRGMLVSGRVCIFLEPFLETL